MRMIDKDALLSDIERTIEESGCVNHEGEIMDCVRYAPEVDAGPVVRGEWINTYSDDEGIGDFVKHCSVCCNAIIKSLSASLNYCPNCGAKMEDKP